MAHDRTHRYSPNDSNRHVPQKSGGRHHDLGKLSVLADWRHIPFLMVDSPQTKLLEDAVAARDNGGGRNWSADLKVVHPLPLQGAVSLKEREPQVCLGIRDVVAASGERAPSISLALTHNLTRITDRQADALLSNRERVITGMCGQNHPDPTLLQRIKSQLKIVRATALQISFWKDRPLTPEHMMAILATHAQTAAIDASRKLPNSPTLIVLRHQGSRSVTDREWKQKGIPYATKSGSSVVAVGKAVPTLLRGGENAAPLDSLRLKERGNSGAINITQIACALLGISPLSDDLVRQGLRPDSEADSWKRGGPLSEPLSAAIQERRSAIREALTNLSKSLIGSQAGESHRPAA